MEVPGKHVDLELMGSRQVWHTGGWKEVRLLIKQLENPVTFPFSISFLICNLESSKCIGTKCVYFK